MNIADLHRLCDALDECGGIHRFTAVVDAAAQVWQAAERRPKPTVERWEDGPHPIGAGMSDKVVRYNLATRGSCACPAKPGEDCPLSVEACAQRIASIAPEGAEAARRVMERLDALSAPAGTPDGLRNAAPIMPERGERLPLPQYDCQDDHDRVLVRHRELAAEYRNGVTHGIGSPIVRDFGCAQNDFGRRPVDPTIEAGDPA
jgi:hypothetical protein